LADSPSSTPPLLTCSLLHLIFLLFVPFFCWNKLSSSKLQSLLEVGCLLCVCLIVWWKWALNVGDLGFKSNRFSSSNASDNCSKPMGRRGWSSGQESVILVGR
jgi:hypothetical protein